MPINLRKTPSAVADRTVRRMSHGAVAEDGMPTCMKDLAPEMAPRLRAYQIAAAAARARFPTAGANWHYTPDTTPARHICLSNG